MSTHPWFGLLFMLTCSLALWGMLTRHHLVPEWVHRHDKAMHFLTFALLAALAHGAWPQTTGLTLWFGLSFLGLLTEALQHLLSSRRFCWRDASANAMGAAAVLVFFQIQG